MPVNLASLTPPLLCANVDYERPLIINGQKRACLALHADIGWAWGVARILANYPISPAYWTRHQRPLPPPILFVPILLLKKVADFLPLFP